MGRRSALFELPPEATAYRGELQKWFAAHPKASARELAEAGFVAPHWPKPWGLDASPAKQLAIDAELAVAGLRRPSNLIGIGWAGPTILAAGTDAQRSRYLPPILSGEEQWCQLFSEPGSGSDLASLSTRAVRDGDVYIVNGQKIWTSLARQAQFGILLARTDPSVAKHRGISYLICPMDAPGVEIRPIRDMGGSETFNEVYFTDVAIPVENLVGDENDGWRLAKVTLANERTTLSGGGALLGKGPDATDLIELVRRRGGVTDPVLRQRVAHAYIEGELLRLLRLRMVGAAVGGRDDGPQASIRKAISDDHGKRLLELAIALSGPTGLLSEPRPLGDDPALWGFGFVFSPAITIGGGSAEVQRNVIAERILGLPHDADPELDRPWGEKPWRGSGGVPY